MGQRVKISDQEIRDSLRAAGMRCTSARVKVLRRLLESSSPLTHAELAEALTPTGIDRATVYRNLVELAEAGLASRLEVGDHVWRFEARRQTEEGIAEHPHFVCVDCGEVSCLPDVSVSIKGPAGKKPVVFGEVTSVLLKGHCGHCPQ